MNCLNHISKTDRKIIHAVMPQIADSHVENENDKIHNDRTERYRKIINDLIGNYISDLREEMVKPMKYTGKMGMPICDHEENRLEEHGVSRDYAEYKLPEKSDEKCDRDDNDDNKPIANHAVDCQIEAQTERKTVITNPNEKEQSEQTNDSIISKSNKDDISKARLFTYVPPKCSLHPEVRQITHWKSALEIIEYNLYDTGVNSAYSLRFAAFLLSAYQNNIPILLAGPNAKEIADAFSMAIAGEKAGTLIVNKGFQTHYLKEDSLGDSKIIKAENVISGMVTAAIPDIIASADRYVIFTHPFAEDIPMEPKRLFSYLLPICTEILLDNTPYEPSCCGKLKDGFEYYESKDNNNHLMTVSGVLISNLVKRKMNIVLTDMIGMLDDEKNEYCDDAFFFCLLPYAYATQQLNSLLEAMHSHNSVKSKISKRRIEDIDSFYGADYE